jgi:hypothetical protein
MIVTLLRELMAKNCINMAMGALVVGEKSSAGHAPLFSRKLVVKKIILKSVFFSLSPSLFFFQNLML